MSGAARYAQYLTAPRYVAGWFCAFLAVALAAPSSQSHIFSGLPLSRPAEFCALIVLLPFLVSPAARRVLGRALTILPVQRRPAILALPTGVLCLKATLLAVGSPVGYSACYWSPIEPLQADACERSFELPFAGPQLTRVDREIDFRPSSWNLTFFNSLRFNYWTRGSRRRDRLPFSAEWWGTLSQQNPTPAEVIYVGQGVVSLDGFSLASLPPSYTGPATSHFQIPPGRHRLHVRFWFDDGSRIRGPTPPGPYAEISLRTAVDGRVAGPLLPIDGSLTTRVLGWVIDLSMAGSVLLLLCVSAILVRRQGRLLRLSGLAVLLAAIMTQLHLHTGTPDLILYFVLAALSVAVVAGARASRLLAVYFIVVLVAVVHTLPAYSSVNTVAYRSAGNDWLTYESFARTILETWSFAGAEPVFYYQPFYPYFRFASRLLLGDGDPLLTALSIAALLFGVLFFIARCSPKARFGRLVLMATSISLFALLWSPDVLNCIDLGLAEYPTWIALPYAVALLFVERRRRPQVLGVVLLTLSGITRTNQLPAVALLFLTFLLRAHCAGWRRRIPGFALLGTAILLLPLAHNLVYGHRFVFTTTSSSIPENLVLRPATLVAAISHGPARRQVSEQVAFVLGSGPVQSALVRVGVHGLQIVWLCCVWYWIHSRSFVSRLVYVVPLAYLGVHLFFQVASYYPRHIVIGYESAALAVALLLRNHTRSPFEAWPWSHTRPGIGPVAAS